MPNADSGAHDRTALRSPAVRLAALLIVALVLISSGVQAQAKRKIRGIYFDIGPHHKVSEELLRNSINLQIGDDFDEVRVQQALDIMLARGVFDKDPDASSYEVTPLGNDVEIVFHLRENPIVTAYEFEGNTVVSDATLTEKVSLVLAVGEVLNTRLLDDHLSTEIAQVYLDAGHQAIVLTPNVSKDGVITVPLVEEYVEEIRLEGLRKTDDKVVERELRVVPGQLIDANELREDQNRVMNLGMFDNVDGSFLPGRELGGQVLVWTMKERKTGYFTVGAGFSTREGFLGYAEVAEENLRGRGQRVSLRAEFGTFMNFDFSFFEPYLDAHHTSLEVTLFRNAYRTGAGVFGGGGLQNFSAESRSGVGLRLNRPLDDELKQNVNLYYRVEETRNYDPRLANLVSPDLLRGRVGSLRLAYVHDTRDIFENPTEGGWYSASLEQAAWWLGSQSTFSKLELDLRQFFPAGDKGVFALRGSYGTTLGTTPPIYESYRVGGAESLRGYREDRWWGLQRALLSAEYRYRISGDTPTRGVQLVLFADYGSAFGGRWQSMDGSALLAENQSFNGAFGYGVGVRVNTPLGPIRLDYGLGREGGRTHFGISQTF